MAPRLEEVRIRNFNSGEYTHLIDLWQRAGLSHKPRGRDKKEHLIRELRNPASRLLVAEYRNRIIGSVLATHDGRKGWINRLAVDIPWRKQGLARRLIRSAEEFLHKQKIMIIACLIEDFNLPSLELFKQCGYREFKGVHYLTKRQYEDV
jgi:ribosomal protein S18 acetylase RimI-like enzyme